MSKNIESCPSCDQLYCVDCTVGNDSCYQCGSQTCGESNCIKDCQMCGEYYCPDCFDDHLVECEDAKSTK